MRAITAPPDGNSFACIAAAWKSHEGELLGFLRHRLSNADAADDLLQDVFVKAMRQGQGFCRLDNPRAWLFQVARNALIDRARLTRPTEQLAEEVDQIAGPEPEPIAPIDALSGCVARVLGELAPEDATTLQACDLG